ncbi:Hemolysin protein [Chondromyces apiculatus DSM 436]|uniref:Hemolysin protein n=1 Tax=Chondromyces apiculatus DSM 436 TaxID=1192034 RepID=A0A017SVT0_9BACT|nr:Hemolysin protein [Chondromyces apiculatus DSM 436]
MLAGAEIAVVSLRKSRLEQLLQDGSRRARAISRLRANPERFFATVQIGITVIGSSAGAFGGASMAGDIEPLVRSVPWLAPHAEEIALAIIIAAISFLSLVLGELVPKSLALRQAEGYAMFIGRPLEWLAWITRPIVWFLTASSNVVLRLFGDSTTFTEARLSPEEIQQMVDEAAQAGTMDKSAGEIASRAIDFAELTAFDVMLPRVKVVGIPKGAPPEEVQRVVTEHGHTRMPVYEGTRDNVVGYITVKDVLAMLWGQRPFALEGIVRPAFYVVETMRTVDILAEMRKRKVQLAIVVDDRGAMSGIVTLEDLVEEIVGEIVGEHDKPMPEPIQREEDGSLVVQGDVPVRDVSRVLDVDLPEGERWSTMAGLCLEAAGRIPVTGERFVVAGGVSLEIVEASPRQVRVVRVRLPAPPPEGEGADPAEQGETG